MHEFSICENLVRVIVAEIGRLGADGRPRRLLKARVVCGCLQGMVPESLQLAYELLTKDTPAQGSSLDVVIAPAVCECRECGWKGAVKAQFIVCGRCGTPDVMLTSGKEIYLDSLEIEE